MRIEEREQEVEHIEEQQQKIESQMPAKETESSSHSRDFRGMRNGEKMRQTIKIISFKLDLFD